MARNRHRGSSSTVESATTAEQLMPAVDEIDVGKRLRSIRTRSGLSMRALAEASNLSVNTLSLIEYGKTSPSVSTLQRVAEALGVPIASFFEQTTAPSRVVFSAVSQRRSVPIAHGALEDLGAGLPDRAVQPFLITLEPDNGSGADDIVHTGHEFVYCLTGQLSYCVDDHAYVLDPGDSLVFESHLPHRWHNAGAVPVKALLILYPSDMRDRPTDRHFMPASRRIDATETDIPLGE